MDWGLPVRSPILQQGALGGVAVISGLNGEWDSRSTQLVGSVPNMLQAPYLTASVSDGFSIS
jgi:hypothetical protein